MFLCLLTIIICSTFIGILYFKPQSFTKVSNKYALTFLWLVVFICTGLLCSNRVSIGLVFNQHAPNTPFGDTINFQYLGQVFITNWIYIGIVIGIYYFITRKLKINPTILLVFLFILNIISYYPGTFLSDAPGSYAQFQKHQYTDFQPPFFTIWWKIFHFYGATFVVNMIMYYGGLIYISYYFIVTKRKWQNDLLVLFSFNPILFTQLDIVWHDISFAGSLIDCVAIYLAITLSKNTLITKLLWCIYAICIFLAVGFRLNGVVAAFPFICLGLFHFLKAKNIKYSLVISLLIGVVISAITLGIHQFITYHVYDAKKLSMQNIIMISDMSYIECETNHEFLLDDAYFVYTGIDKREKLCNEAINYFNSDGFYANWGGGGVPIVTSDLHEKGYEFDQLLKNRWKSAILSHPIAYLDYRMKFFVNVLFYNYWYPTDNTSYLKDTLFKMANIQHFDMKIELSIFLISSTFVILFLSLYFGIYNLAFCILASNILQLISWYFLIPVHPARYFFWDWIAMILSICLFTVGSKKNSIIQVNV